MTPSETRPPRPTRPRIRTIKPEALQHRKVGRLTDREFRLWVGMITQADDEGRLVADAGQLRAWFFGFWREVSEDDVETALAAIAGLELIRLYDVDGVRYASFPSWDDHQMINRPTPSRLPAPPLHGAFHEPSLSPHSGSDRIGKDQIGKDTIGGEVLGGGPTTRSETSLEIHALIDQMNQLYTDLGMDSAEYTPIRERFWNQHVGGDVSLEQAAPDKVKAILAKLKAMVSRRPPLSVNGRATR